MTDLLFDCYLYIQGNGEQYTLFQFFPDGVWDEDKLTLKEAIKKYGITRFHRKSFGPCKNASILS